MAPFITRGNLIAIASDSNIHILNLNNQTCQKITLPPQPSQQHQILKITNADESHISLGTCLAFSQCGSFLAVCATRKQLTVWNIETSEMLRQWETPRKVSALTFSRKNNQLIVSDKAGDVYLYDVSVDSEKGTLLLGHLSMLLDVVVTRDDKFIITCDRDEKIRISCFPNAYNIHSFCLGHTEFVSCLSLLPSNLLLSTSGDGTLRIWNYESGKELHSLTIRTDAEMEKAIRMVTVHSISETNHKVAIISNRCPDLFLCNILDSPLRCIHHKQTLECNPLAAAFTEEGELYILTDSVDNPVKRARISWDQDGNCNYEELDLTQLLIDNYDIIRACSDSCNGDMKPLYKRWFDNVQEYRKRKEERLGHRKEIESTAMCNSKRVRVD